MFTMLVLSAGTLMAQNAPGAAGGFGGQGGQGGGGRGGRGNIDPAARTAQQLEDVKLALGASDEEWQVLSPKIAKLIQVNSEVQAGQARGGGRRGGAGGPNGGRGGTTADSGVARALAELRTTLENANATADQISMKLTALRDARTKAKAALDMARKDVKDLLTARQEAILVATYGYLE